MARKASTKAKSGGKPPKAKKTKASVPGASGVAAGPGHNSVLTFDQERSLFLSHRSTWLGHEAKQIVLDEQRAKIVSALKNDGFTVKQMDIADALTTTKGEKRVHGEVKDRLKVARFIGHKMGEQYDMFEQPSRTPSVDVAYDQGKQASMENHVPKPAYAPDLPQYQAYMRGYHDHQATLVPGNKPKEPMFDDGPTDRAPAAADAQTDPTNEPTTQH